MKSVEEIEQLRSAAHLVRDLLVQLHKIIRPGITELDIDSFCENYILLRGGDPVLRMEEQFSCTVMVSTNNLAFHNIPGPRILGEGDIVTVDVVLVKNGWFGDGAWTYVVGECSSEIDKMINVSRDCIYSCIEILERTGDLASLGSLLDNMCEESNFRILEEGAGHGIGRDLHEDPCIPFSGTTDSIPLRKGMVFTIEPVFTNYYGQLKYTSKGAAYVAEGYFASQFEHMVAVTEAGIELLTDRKSLF